jgi:hypothetical protein
VASAVAPGLVGWAASAALHARQRRAVEAASRPHYQVTIASPEQAIPAPPRAAIEAARASLADLEDLAAQHGYN